MRVHWLFTHVIVLATAFGLVLPRPIAVRAAECYGSPWPDHVPPVRDVVLGPGGSLTGWVVDRQGAPVAHAAVQLHRDGQIVATARTAADGRLDVPGLSSGVYQLVVEQRVTWCRVWHPELAPPAAERQLLLAIGSATRGQYRSYYDPRRTRRGLGSGHYGGALLRFVDRPWVAAGLVATGIALPLALDDQDDAS